MNLQHADNIRLIYAIGCMVVAFGLSATVVLRWDELAIPERIIRIGLVGEHIAIIYIAWIGIRENFPPNPGSYVLLVAVGVTIIGLTWWMLDLYARTHQTKGTRHG